MTFRIDTKPLAEAAESCARWWAGPEAAQLRRPLRARDLDVYGVPFEAIPVKKKPLSPFHKVKRLKAPVESRDVV